MIPKVGWYNKSLHANDKCIYCELKIVSTSYETALSQTWSVVILSYKRLWYFYRYAIESNRTFNGPQNTFGQLTVSLMLQMAIIQEKRDVSFS